MSIEADDVEHGRSVECQNEEIIKLLKALLLGVELITDNNDLLDDIEE